MRARQRFAPVARVVLTRAGTAPSCRARLMVALALGLSYGVATARLTAWRVEGVRVEPTIDFGYWWSAASALLAGLNPYTAVGPGGPFGMPNPFVYPLPAALVTVPFTSVDAFTAAGLFTGISVALAAYAVTARGFGMLWLFASAPATILMGNGQWAPLMIAAALLPGLGGLLVVKPTIGLALAAYRPRWDMAIGAVVLVVVAFVVLPTWVLDWLAAIERDRIHQGAQYVPPILVGPGALCLLAALRWRRPEARLLVALACMPQNYFFYDQLYLGLIFRSRWSAMAGAVWSHVVYALASTVFPTDGTPAIVSAHHARFIVIGFYLPATILVLLRRNEGAAAAWIERLIVPLPSWLRGTVAPVKESGG